MLADGTPDNAKDKHFANSAALLQARYALTHVYAIWECTMAQLAITC